MNQETTNFKTFNYQENGQIAFSILSTIKTTSVLDSGFYNIETVWDNGYKTNLSLLENIENYNSTVPYHFKEKLDKIFKVFYDSTVKKNINKLGYKHKVGVLLHGKQGTGKTSLLKSYFEKAYREQNAIVFNYTSLDNFSKTWDFIKGVRKIQNNPIVIFLDECDELFSKYNVENAVKVALDGFDSIDNCIILMATNYIDKIPETIKDRPSRVKYTIEVEGIQDEEVISNFLKESFEKVNMEFNLEKEVSKMKGWTIDDLKQWVLDKVMDIEPEEKVNNKMGFSK